MSYHHRFRQHRTGTSNDEYRPAVAQDTTRDFVQIGALTNRLLRSANLPAFGRTETVAETRPAPQASAPGSSATIAPAPADGFLVMQKCVAWCLATAPRRLAGIAVILLLVAWIS